MKVKLTARLLDQVKDTESNYELYDTDLNGFYLKVFYTGAKVFFVRYRLENGKRCKLKIGRADALTVAEAREIAKKILAEVAIGKDPKAPKYTQESKIPTLQQFVKEQYQSWCETHLQCPDKQLAKLYKFVDFLNLPLDEINPQKVEKWRSACLKKGQAPATVNRNIVVLKSVISKAVQWEILELHPLRRLKQLKVDRSPNIRYLSEDEEQRLRAALEQREAKVRADRTSANLWREERGYDLLPDLHQLPFVDYLKPLVLLSLNTGARQGELFRMHWGDINFERRSLALVMRGKRKSYTRHIPLNREAYDVLISWRSMQPEADKLVFPSKDGEKFDNIQTSWENLKKLAGIVNFRWHDMRHHFASRLVMNGVPLNTVRELLGHMTVEMTLRYAHLAPEQKEKAVATLDKLVVV